MSYTITIPIEVVNATHPGGYRELYLKYVQEGYTPQKAWEMVEDRLEKYGLPGRYSTYESFRVCLWKGTARRQFKQWQHRKHL